MSEGIFVGIWNQLELWCIGLFINWSKSERLRPAMKGSKGAAGVLSVAFPLVVFLVGGSGFLSALCPAPDILKVSGGELQVEREGEPKGLEEELVCRVSRGLTRILHKGVSLPTRN